MTSVNSESGEFTGNNEFIFIPTKNSWRFGVVYSCKRNNNQHS